MDLKETYGNWAIVTGASSDIGRANELAAKGFNLVIISRNRTVLEKIADEVEAKFNIDVIELPINLRDENLITVLSMQTEAPDAGIVASIAGEMYLSHHTGLNPDEELDLIRLNIIAPTVLSSYFAKKLGKRKRCGIILTGSMLGYQGTPYFTTYAGTKAYEIVRDEGLAYELRKHGVDILVMNPGLTKTLMTAGP